MIVTYKIYPLDPDGIEADFKLNKITQCPICKKSISPNFLYGVSKRNSVSTSIYCFFLCDGCENTFMGTYSQVFLNNINNEPGEIISVEPSRFTEEIFDNSIKELSPQFVKIYNQALAAETSHLDEIAGLGYRKSLEFLIKDFAIKRNPDSSEKIKALQLSPCINTYIDSPNIKTLAIKSTWIGNDEAHYIRKQENRDINDMKRFISATVYFISMILITDDAESIEPAK